MIGLQPHCPRISAQCHVGLPLSLRLGCLFLDVVGGKVIGLRDLLNGGLRAKALVCGLGVRLTQLDGFVSRKSEREIFEGNGASKRIAEVRAQIRVAACGLHAAVALRRAAAAQRAPAYGSAAQLATAGPGAKN